MFKVRILDDYVEPIKLVDETVLVETAGYVPRQKTIENLILSGQRLIQSRMEEYDGKTVDEALENAPRVRVDNLDIVDSVDYLHQLSESKGNSSGDSGAKDNNSLSVTESVESNKSGE